MNKINASPPPFYSGRIPKGSNLPKRQTLPHSPCCRIFPKYLLWLVQFQRRKRNWYWHSRTPSLAPLATSCTISGSVWHNSACFPASRLVFRQMLLGSMTNGLPTALERLEKRHGNTLIASKLVGLNLFNP